jgi:branched-chain amino acid aminotransferase
VIEVAGASERACTLADLSTAEEVFLASTTREVQPVAAVDGRMFDAAGPVTVRIQRLLSARIQAELAA